MVVAGVVRPTVGLLALTLELYETLAPDLRGGRERWLRREVLPALEGAARIVFDKAVFRREDVEAQVSRFESEGVDALVVILLTYCPSQIVLPALKRTRIPIIIWNTQELSAVDGCFSGSAMIANHGVHGTQDLCNVLLRSGVRFDYATSHPRDDGATDSLEDFFCAAAAVHRVALATLGPERILYGTDNPVFYMRGRRQWRGREYVNRTSHPFHFNKERESPEVEAGYTLYMYEALRALKNACEELAISRGHVEAIFHGNADRLIRSVLAVKRNRGEQ